MVFGMQEYGELQAATREQKAKPALDGIVDKIQKVSNVLQWAKYLLHNYTEVQLLIVEVVDQSM